MFQKKMTFHVSINKLKDWFRKRGYLKEIVNKEKNNKHLRFQ